MDFRKNFDLIHFSFLDSRKKKHNAAMGVESPELDWLLTKLTFSVISLFCHYEKRISEKHSETQTFLPMACQRHTWLSDSALFFNFSLLCKLISTDAWIVLTLRA